MSTGSTKSTIYNHEDARAIGLLMKEMKALSDDMHAEVYLEGEVRIWNVNGYSLGVVRNQDGFWIFEYDYQEL